MIVPPDLNQARVNKCLIALVNRKIVTKDNSTVGGKNVLVAASVAEVVFREGHCIIPLARCGHLIRYPLEWSLYFFSSHPGLFSFFNSIYVPLESGARTRSPLYRKKNEQERNSTTRYACVRVMCNG
jgi:hypothetical protein